VFRQPIGTGPVQVSVGHWTDAQAQTGCTVVLFDRPAQAVVDVRGGAPGTRETDLLGDGHLVEAVDAILLAGGSAFGLAAAAGVTSWLRERGRGVQSPAGTVPIVPSAILYDLAVGDPTWPDESSGRSACDSARPVDELGRGRVGVGAGATIGKLWAGRPARPGGFGMARIERVSLGTVTALVAVNSAGDVLRSSGAAATADERLQLLESTVATDGRTATTLGVLLVEGAVDRRALVRCAVAAHDGLARTIRPCHTIFDGDVIFAVGLRHGTPEATDVLRLSVAAELAVELAVIDAVTAGI
jgi:L-aminopeptidase/D-esterase-like protein